ncbi:hypothetical protein [Methylobacterium sp. J-076]|uniref:hypothetical protein n=1 Tax=Methylobacterium sp. J-076 TaxID=2836655 RepID=UPI001FBA0537|nr:hypothetical protein [Methylobacterium sp. J-076]MCJ2012248.1 hypothetical protein [Methylobacterium sp. J-076]
MTMPHSIFIRERKGDTVRPPELVAYDIDSVTLANRLVRRIAKSCSVNGFDCATGRRWFRFKNTVFDIYRLKTDL